MRVDTDAFLRDAMRIVLSDNDAREYVTRALNGRKAKDAPTRELEDITLRAVEIAKENRNGSK